MAKAAAADAEELPEEGEAKPAKSKKKLFIYGGAGAGLIVVLALVYFMFFTGKAVEKAEPKAVYFELPEMTVNLSATSERPQYLRIKVSLEMTDAAVIDAIKTAQPRVIDAFQVHLRELRAVDLEGSAGIYRLREELMRRINLAIAPAKIRAVLFKEIVVQ
jgi:flagellar FliL protein